MFFLLFKRPNFACIFRTNCWPRRRARPANRPNSFQPLRFTNKFEIITKRWRRLTPPSRRIICSARPLASQKVGSKSQDFSNLVKRKCAKILKSFIKLKWPHWLRSTRLLKLSNAAIKKGIDKVERRNNIQHSKTVFQQQFSN